MSDKNSQFPFKNWQFSTFTVFPFNSWSSLDADFCISSDYATSVTKQSFWFIRKNTRKNMKFWSLNPFYKRSNWKTYQKNFLKPTVSSRAGTSPFLRETPSSWSKFKKLLPSFWEPPKLVHASCMKHFKMKELHFVLYKSIKNTIIITLYTLRLNSVFTTVSLVRYCLKCFSYLIYKRNEHEIFLLTISLL